MIFQLCFYSYTSFHNLNHYTILNTPITNHLKQMQKELRVKNKLLIYLISITIVAGCFFMGYSFVCISFLEDFIRKANSENVGVYLSLATTAVPVGALIGTFMNHFRITFLPKNHWQVWRRFHHDHSWLYGNYRICLTDLFFTNLILIGRKTYHRAGHRNKSRSCA